MEEIIIVTIAVGIVVVIISICFYCFGYISKELVLYGIDKVRQADRHTEFMKELIDKSKKK